MTIDTYYLRSLRAPETHVAAGTIRVSAGAARVVARQIPKGGEYGGEEAHHDQNFRGQPVA